MSVFDKGLPLSLTACRLEYAHDGGLWTSSLPMDVTATAYAPGARDAWREAIVGALFRTFFAPLWQSLSQVSGLPQHILWENTAVRVYSLYQGRMEGLTPIRRSANRRILPGCWKRLNRHCLVCHGTRSNAFVARYNRRGGKQVRFRRTCCFYYKTVQPVEYCHNCPLCKATSF
jgi:ferric iron reductase protein FhuF